MTDTRISQFGIYCKSSTSRLPVFPERLSAMRAFATANGKKKGRNWANRRCQHSKTKCKMPVGRRFMGLNLALIYLFDNPGCFKRRPPLRGIRGKLQEAEDGGRKSSPSLPEMLDIVQVCNPAVHSWLSYLPTSMKP